MESTSARIKEFSQGIIYVRKSPFNCGSEVQQSFRIFAQIFAAFQFNNGIMLRNSLKYSSRCLVMEETDPILPLHA